MTATRPRTLLAIAAVVGVVVWSLLRLLQSSGGSPLPLPWTAVGGMLVIGAVVTAAGWPVRQFNRGRQQQRFDALRAARTVVLAKACSYSGAALAGFYAAQVVLVLPDLSIEPRRERLFMAGAAVLAALVMVAAGLVVERWCRLPPRDEDGEEDDDLGPVTQHHP